MDSAHQARALLNVFLWELKTGFRLRIPIGSLRRGGIGVALGGTVVLSVVGSWIWRLYRGFQLAYSMPQPAVVLVLVLGYMAVSSAINTVVSAPRLRDLSGRLGVLRSFDIKPSSYFLVWVGSSLLPGLVLASSIALSFVWVFGWTSEGAPWGLPWLSLAWCVVLPFCLGSVTCLLGTHLRPQWNLAVVPLALGCGVVGGLLARQGRFSEWNPVEWGWTSVIGVGGLSVASVLSLLAYMVLLWRQPLRLFSTTTVGRQPERKRLGAPKRTSVCLLMPRALLSQLMRANFDAMFWRRTAWTLAIPAALGGWAWTGGGISPIVARALIAVEGAALLGLLDVLAGTLGFVFNLERLRWLTETVSSAGRVATVSVLICVGAVLPGPLCLAIVMGYGGYWMAAGAACSLAIITGAIVIASETLFPAMRGPDGSSVEDPLVNVVAVGAVMAPLPAMVANGISVLACVGMTVWTVVCVVGAIMLCRMRLGRWLLMEDR